MDTAKLVIPPLNIVVAVNQPANYQPLVFPVMSDGIALNIYEYCLQTAARATLIPVVTVLSTCVPVVAYPVLLTVPVPF